MSRPDALLIGAPDAGLPKMQALLAGHRDVAVEWAPRPDFVLEDRWRDELLLGPGDRLRRSTRPPYWTVETAMSPLGPVAACTVRSSPFALWDRAGHARLAQVAPDARLVVVVRDPAERAHANWSRLRALGLEPEADFLMATGREDARRASRWAPWWRYVELGRYGEQLAHLLTCFPPSQVLVVRHRDLVDEPAATSSSLAVFLDLDPDGFSSDAEPATRSKRAERAESVVRRSLRAGLTAAGVATDGSAPTAPRLARLRRALARSVPPLTAEARASVMGHYGRDVQQLMDVTGRDFSDWLDDGSASVRPLRQPSPTEGAGGPSRPPRAARSVTPVPSGAPRR